MRPLVVLLLLALPVAAAPPDRTAAIERAAAWLAAFPADQLRFDAAVMLHGIRTHADSPALDAAWARARAVADRDHDHPLRRLWDADVETPAGVTRGWTVPQHGEPRANTERLLIEAVHCDRHGIRRRAVRYACTTMRDGGGFHSTHALWGLVLARERGCEPRAKLDRCTTTLVAELRRHQPVALRPARTLDLDLFAERTLMRCLADAPRDVAADLAALLTAQRGDGSWGVPDPDEPPYFRYHATAIAAWALAACP